MAIGSLAMCILNTNYSSNCSLSYIIHISSSSLGFLSLWISPTEVMMKSRKCFVLIYNNIQTSWPLSIILSHCSLLLLAGCQVRLILLGQILLKLFSQISLHQTGKVGKSSKQTMLSYPTQNWNTNNWRQEITTILMINISFPGILSAISGALLVLFFAKLDELIGRQYYQLFEVAFYIYESISIYD